MKILFTPEHYQDRKGDLYLDTLLLIPGISEVDDSIKEHPSFNSLVKLGAIAVLDEPKPKALKARPPDRLEE
jgi:hypothetical protein